MKLFILKKRKQLFSILLISLISISALFHISLRNQIEINKLSLLSNFFGSNIRKYLNDNPFPIKSSNNDVIQNRGGNLDTLLYLNLSDQVLSRNTSSDFSINTNGWNITKTDLLFTNIFAETDKDIEVASTEGENRLDYFRAMSFNVTSISYLKKINVNLELKLLYSGNDINISVFNAKATGEPNKIIHTEGFDLNGYLDGWIEFNLSKAVLLDPANTNNSKFFIGLKEWDRPAPPYSQVKWLYLNDGSNEGDAYTRSILGVWSLSAIDYTLSLTLNTEVLPSEIELKVNGTYLEDLQVGNGTWNSSDIYIGPNVLFNVESNISSSFNVNWTCQFINQTFSNTYFISYANKSIVNWNASIFTEFHAKSSSRGINITIPRDWNITTVLNDSSTHLFWMNVTENGKKINIISNVFNSSWIVVCNGPNYVHEISLEKKVDSNFIPVTRLVNGTDIIRINASIKDGKGTKITNGNGSLTVFDPNETVNYIDHTPPNNTHALNGVVSFQPWQVNLTGKGGGNYTIQVVWYNQTEVGINVTTIDIKTIPTQLTLINNTPSADTGDPIYAIVYFNDSYWGYGIPNANFYLFNNQTSDYHFDFTVDPSLPPVGNYSISISTATLTAGSYEFVIIANRSIYNTSTVNITFIIQGSQSFAWIIDGADPVGPRLGGQTYDNGSFVYDNYNTTLSGDDPYWDDTSRTLTIYYNDTNGNPITIEQVDLVDIRWDNNETDIIPTLVGPGLYNVTVDTTGLATGTHFLTIIMQTSLYYRAYLNVSVNIKPVPTQIDPGEYASVSQYEGETLEFWVAYLDVFHSNQRIESPPAIINYTFSGINGSMTYRGAPNFAYQGFLDLGNLSVGTYNLTISASAGTEYQPKIRNINVNIIPKLNVSLYLIDIPNETRIGEILNIKAKLVNKTNSVPLVGYPIELKITFLDSQNNTLTELVEISSTNVNGKIEESIEVPQNSRYVNISLFYRGDINVSSAINNTILNIAPKRSVNMILFSPTSSIWVGNVLLIGASLIYGDNGEPVEKASVEFEILFLGEKILRFTQIGKTGPDGNVYISFAIPSDISGVNLIIINARHEGSSSVASTTSNIFPINLLSVSRFFVEYIWLFITIIGSVGALSSYKTWNFMKNRGWKKKINHLFIITEGGSPIKEWKMGGVALDASLVSGALSGISSIVREMTKSV
ncbi:MAG: hypothetical protein ACFFDN_16890, partial [Candidatus Hodarchaeota archaeon]